MQGKHVEHTALKRETASLFLYQTYLFRLIVRRKLIIQQYKGNTRHNTLLAPQFSTG
jgi:hypothetical protein